MSKDGEFQKIDEADETTLGPEAILVTGFGEDIEEPLRKLLAQIGTPTHRVIRCTPEMVKQSLLEALETEVPGEPAAPDKLPRTMVLSGLNGGQLQSFLTAYRQASLPSSIFASVTPINLEFPVGKLIMELLNEQRAMARRR